VGAEKVHELTTTYSSCLPNRLVRSFWREWGGSKVAVKFYRCITEGEREEEDRMKEKNNFGYKPCSVVVG
jgi:hypothetical protein